MLESLRSFFSSSPLQLQAHDSYVTLVEQARKPFFFRDWAVPDTLDGRFDVVVLHLFLVIHRMRGETEPQAAEFVRALSEAFFADMDRSLREMGVGDTGVPHRVKKMAQAFYGRLGQYEQSLQKASELEEVLKRNLYRGEETNSAGVRKVVDYMQRNAAHLTTQTSDAILDGRLNFLD